MYYQIVKKVWDSLKVVCSNPENSSLKLDIRTQFHGLKLRDQTIKQNYNSLKSLWHELDLVTDMDGVVLLIA